MSIHDYAAALAATNGRDSKRIANNTYAERRYPYTMDNPSVAIRFHKTDIVTYHPQSAEQGGEVVELSSGNWRTHITLARINAYLPHGWRGTSTAGVWDISTGERSWVFIDGIMIDRETGQPLQGTFLDPNQEAVLLSAVKELKRKVKAYLTKLPQATEKWRLALLTGGIDPRGDCLYCQGIVRDMSGATVVDVDHLWSHLNEGYTPFTLLLRAYEHAVKFSRGGEWDKPAQDYLLTHIAYGMDDAIGRYLRKYMLDQLNPIARVAKPQPHAPGTELPKHYLEWAEAALEYPSDYGYMGDDETLYKASAPSWTRTRDSENVDLANFELVEKGLIEAFPDLWGNRVEDKDGHTYDRDDEKGYPQIYIMRSGHWAVGWIEQIVVPVLADPAKPLALDNLHPVWLHMCRLKEQTDMYPYLDGAEELAAEMDTTQQVESIQSTIEWLNRFDTREVPAEPTAADVLWEIQVIDDEYTWDSDQVVRALGSIAHAAYLEELEDSQEQLPL